MNTPIQWIDPYTRRPNESHDLHSQKVRHALIAEAAFFRAERRGFAPGHELEDWLAAEAEVDMALTLGRLVP